MFSNLNLDERYQLQLNGSLFELAKSIRSQDQFPRLRNIFCNHVVDTYDNFRLVGKFIGSAERYILRLHIHNLYLRYLEMAGPPVRLTELKDFNRKHSLISHNAITEFVALGEYAGHLRRVRDPSDKRSRLIEPTETGMDLLKSNVVTSSLPVLELAGCPVDRKLLENDRFVQEIILSASSKSTEIIAAYRLFPDIDRLVLKTSAWAIALRLLSSPHTVEGNPDLIVFPYVAKAEKFHISRSHVRNIIDEMASHGLVVAHQKGGKIVEILPRLRNTIDSYLALRFALQQTILLNAVSAFESGGTPFKQHSGAALET